MNLRGLSPSVRAHADLTLAWANYYGIGVTVTSTLRSWNEQQALYTRYLRGESRWPANPPGESAHNWGLAWDSVANNPAHQPAWNYIRRALGWHVPVRDEIHAAVPGWRQYVSGKPRPLTI